MIVASLLLLQSVVTIKPAHETGTILQPSHKWVLDYAETNCTAVRLYAAPAGQVLLALRPSPSGDVMRLTISRPQNARSTYHFPVEIAIDAQLAKTTGLRFPGDKSREIVWVNLDKEAWRRLQGAKTFGIKGKWIDERLALPGINKVIAGLDACNDNLRKYWNVENAGGVAVVHPALPTGAPERWLTSTDYPEQAAEQRKGGRVAFTLLIDEAGAVKDCMIDTTTGIASLDVQGCIAIPKRAKFKPARDAEGKPVRSMWRSTVTWIAP